MHLVVSSSASPYPASNLSYNDNDNDNHHPVDASFTSGSTSSALRLASPASVWGVSAVAATRSPSCTSASTRLPTWSDR